MVTKKIISTLLAVIMLLSMFAITAGAEDTAEGDRPEYTYNTSSAKPTMDYFKGQSIPEKEGGEAVDIKTAEEKLKTMDLRLEKDGYRLYVDAYSGEVATYCIATGETLFTNPYTIGETTSTDSIKQQLMSQIVVKYTDLATGNENTYYSYEWAASRGQIAVKNIKNGLRVEYTIGREEARMLCPRQVEKESFETKILNVAAAALEGGEKNFTYRKLSSYYSLKDPSKLSSQTAIDEMYKTFPITKKMPVYVLDSTTSTVEMAKIEGIIKTYCPNYTYEDLDEDHLKTEYESDDENPPLFKMALEYTLDKHGVSVRLPANGIRFNEILYQLYSIEILPYMGAGRNPNPGYTFFPDGSGTLFDFEKIADLGTATTVTGKIYGQDYAYHTITGTHQEIIRYPVFGITETETFAPKAPETTPDAGEAAVEGEGTAPEGEGTTPEGEVTPPAITTKDRGFLAIVEEGDALMELSAYHAVRTSPYNTVRMIVYPRPQDTYNIQDAISVGTNDTWTVVSSRKYTGNYKVRYIMLTDDKVAKDKGIEDFYDCNYVGMAKAYRDYLEASGVLTRLTEDDVKENIPVYINTFGAIETTKRILSVPITTRVPLTSFENIKTMHDELSAKGVDNINFILTGFTKGGMTKSKIPYHLKWDKAVGGKKGFEDLIAYAKENEIGIYPDFDFVFVTENTMFDGISLKKHAVKTIDNRYTSKRVYSATKQTYISYFELAISPAFFNRFYEKLTENYLKFDPIGISVSSLGSYLNSDFDEDDPYNREDAKGFTIDAFKYLDEKYNKVMTASANAYTWAYVDHITDVALDSSRYSQAGASVPFLGMVLHGYVQFAGTPINMEGNIDYAMLKAIENGAALNFILSYQNTDLLKESETLSKYYSVRYDIWFDDVVEIYNELNSVLKDVQTSIIVDHKFVEGQRVPDADEIEADAKAELEAAMKLEQDLIDAKNEADRLYLLEARKGIVEKSKEVKESADSTLNWETTLNKNNNVQEVFDKYVADKAAYDTEKAALDALKASTSATEAEIKAQQEKVDAALTVMTESRAAIPSAVDMVYGYVIGLEKQAYKADQALKKANEYLAYLKANSNLDASLIAELEATIDSVVADNEAAKTRLTNAKKVASDAYTLVKDVEGIVIKPYDFVPSGEEIVPEPEEEEVKESTKYNSDENMITLVTYSNGTSIILNFNNYDVTTVVDGVIYMVQAYGYVVLGN